MKKKWKAIIKERSEERMNRELQQKTTTIEIPEGGIC